MRSKTKWTLMIVACVAISWPWMHAYPSHAQSEHVSEADAVYLRSTITSQIDAIRAGDGGAAYGFASPGIQAKFGSPAAFMQMIRQGYGALVDPRDIEFGAITDELGMPTQVVTIVDRSGQHWQALYAFERQPDGSWRISGCVLKKLAGESV